MQGNAEQSSLRCAVHGKIEDGRLNDAVHHALYFSGRLLEDEHVVDPEKRDARRLIESRHNRSHSQVRIQHDRPGGLRVHCSAGNDGGGKDEGTADRLVHAYSFQ